MTPPFPLTTAEWHTWLSDYNAEVINSADVRTAIEEDRQVISQERLDAGWAGAPSAGEEAIVAVEERLGVRLPPSYRNFLKVSDGWEYLGPIDLFRVGEIGWLADIDGDLLEAWDMEYFQEQLAILRRCVMIAHDNGGSGCWWLLHADSAREDGEWTAYEWWPGDGSDPEPYDDFATMVRKAKETWLTE
ncbi:SMI1/KNR4 family protein [Streptomyces sp. C1-2]|uniref:SMI1/KNR4 family protein n=1 Tax=Streptomyces sp. C1-2 TaxID=2720022 RepID=UPI0014325680|nr:SMI1/KNR4 family protein [Streptomyces sp. C1-2]NJP72780.1 SMI1/KNR4 family protein [Streptomyces sp. C1-2]